MMTVGRSWLVYDTEGTGQDAIHIRVNVRL
jgi:hypothetical protein